MDIKIRGVDPMAVRKLDELAAQKKLSRNAYLVQMLQNFTALKETQSAVEESHRLTKNVLAIIARNTQALAAAEQSLTEIQQLILGGELESGV